MKKIYSILTLAALLTAGEAFAQTKGVSGNEVTFEGPWTIEAINFELAKVVYGTVDVSKVEGIDGETVVTKSPNTVIVAKDKEQLANTTNVLVYVPIRDLGTGETTYFPWMENFVLTDGYDWLCEREFDAGHAYYERVCKNEYNTLCLPFCFYIEELMHARSDMHLEILTKVEKDVLTFTQISATNYDYKDESATRPGHHVAGRTPLVCHLHEFAAGKNTIVIEPKGAVSVNAAEDSLYNDLAYTLTGQLKATVISTDVNSDMYYIQDNYFWKLDDYIDPETNKYATVEVPAFRCILDNFDNSKEIDHTAGVKNFKIVSADAEATSISSVSTTLETPAYNLQGVRVAPTAKGFVLKNGKKYFNK